MIGSAQISTRNLRPGEAIPAELSQQLSGLTIDPDWAWAATAEDSRIIAICLGAYAHGTLFILRLVSLPDAGIDWAVPLLRYVMCDAAYRGCSGYLTFLEDSPQRPWEQKLACVIHSAGGVLKPFSGYIAGGSTDVSLSGRRRSKLCRSLFFPLFWQ